jgi:hypothetical protein
METEVPLRAHESSGSIRAILGQCVTNVLLPRRVATTISATVITSTIARQIMSKRLVVKLGVTVAVLGAMTLLQGCNEEEDGVLIRFAWSPVGFAPNIGFAFGPSQGSMGGGGQTASAPTGGVTAGGAAAAAGGGNQVSGGAGF